MNHADADITRLAACDGAPNPNAIDEGGFVGLSLENLSDGQFVYSNAFFVRTTSDAEADLTALASGKFPPCLKAFVLPRARADIVKPGIKLTGVSVAPLTVRSVGDQSIAYRVTQHVDLSGQVASQADQSQGDFYQDFVYIRNGAAEVAVEFDSFNDQPFNVALQAVLLGKLDAKLQASGKTSSLPSVVHSSPASPITSAIASTVSSPTTLNNTTPSYVLPAPDGYTLSTGSGTPNGPITPSDFDGIVGAGAAGTTGFMHGYDVTYDSNVSDESIESTLFTFASPVDAAGFEPEDLANAGAAGLSPTRSSLSSIHGSVVLTGTKAAPGGFYIIDVIAIKGATIMEVEYANDEPLSGVPDVLSTSASLQYAHL